MIDLPERRINLFSARLLIKGDLVLGIEKDGTTDFPLSVLDLLDILKICEKLRVFRLKLVRA